MEKLGNFELSQVEGGGKILWGILGAAATLIVGIISGWVNPNKCNNK